MPRKDQKHNNRSQGQRIRRTNERAGDLAETVETHQDVLEQHDRDIKMLKARVSEVERRRSSQY